MGRGEEVGGPPSNYACLNGLAVVENVAAGRIKVFEAGINVGALIIIAVNEERVDLIPALIAHGVPAWRRNPVTDELPHATVLQHTSVLTGSTLGIQVVELLFASHCQFDLACCKAMDGPNGSRVRTTVGAALQTLAQANWRGRHDNVCKNTLHRKIKGEVPDGVLLRPSRTGVPLAHPSTPLPFVLTLMRAISIRYDVIALSQPRRLSYTEWQQHASTAT